MQDIKEVLWFDGEHVRPFAMGDKGHAFKWILARTPLGLLLMAMPDDTPLDFHKELWDAICLEKGWDQNKLKVLGGGVRLKDGKILHRSTYFGEMPHEFRESIISLLNLK